MATTAHAVLRDRGRWRGRMRGLAVQADGDLSLARVPAPADGRAIDIPVAYPYPRVASGLATGPCETLFVADTAHDRILFVDGQCGARAWLPARSEPVIDAPGHFDAPRGLAAGPDYLLVADHGHGSLQQLAFPRLEANRASSVVAAPLSVALDAPGNQLVVDAGTGRVVRICADGSSDAQFAARLAQQTDLRSPFAVAASATGEVLVADSVANAVFVFDAEGRFVRVLPGPGVWLPGALAAHGEAIYVADAATGAILVFAAATLQGSVDGWRGPVTALAVGASGDLYVKPGLDTTYYRFAAGAAFVREGELVAGPFDAGEEQVWERAWIDAEVPREGRADVEVALKASADPPRPRTGCACRRPTRCWRAPRARAPLRLAAAAACHHCGARGAGGAAAALRDRGRGLSRLPSHDVPAPRPRRVPVALAEAAARRVRPRRGSDRHAAAPGRPRFRAAGLDALAGAVVRARTAADRGRRRSARADRRRGAAVRAPRRTGVDRAVRRTAHRHPPGDRRSVRGTARVGAGRFVATRLRHAPAAARAGRRRRARCGARSLPGSDRSAVVGASGPLAPYQIGLPLYADEAYRFCVVVDAYRVRDPRLLDELRRIVDREKPAHTDYRVQVVAPEMRVGFQARIGIDAIVGGEPPAPCSMRRGSASRRACRRTRSRAWATRLDGTLTLN